MAAKNMEVIRKMNHSEFADVDDNVRTSKHIFERKSRVDISSVGDGYPCAGFVVDRNHVNGLEEHIIYSNGVIVIRNHHTKKLVTFLVARPMQIKRYYDALGFIAPPRLLQLAHTHTMMGLHRC